MGAKEDKLRKAASKLGFRLVKTKPKTGFDYKTITWEIFFLVGHCIKPLKKRTHRAAVMAATLDRRLDKILDKYFKGAKRKAFDDKTQKNWTYKTVIQDIKTIGQFKRYKLVEREYSKKFNSQVFKVLFDPDYFPPKKADGTYQTTYGPRKKFPK